MESCELMLLGTQETKSTQKAAVVHSERSCPNGVGKKKKSADREEKIFTSTVYNLIYKYILGIN